MATTTSVYGWPIPELTDSPNAPQQFSDLGDAIEATIGGTTQVGVPGTATISIAPSAWTTVASVSFTLPATQNVEIVGWARLLNTGSTRPIVALQVVDGSTHLFGTGQTDVWGTGDSTGVDIAINTPRRRVTLASGSHTLNLQVYKDSNGTIDAKKTSTFASQDIAVTGIEVSY